jgi:hypothetical protein
MIYASDCLLKKGVFENPLFFSGCGGTRMKYNGRLGLRPSQKCCREREPEEEEEDEARCTLAAALDLDSNRGKKGEMGCNIISPIDLSYPMEVYGRASFSKLKAGGQAVIASAKLDIKNSKNSAKANTNTMVSATNMASNCVAVRPATTASATTTASDCVADRPATVASDYLMVFPKMATVFVCSAMVAASDCVAVCYPKVMHVSAAKTDTKAGPAANEWVNVYPSVVPTKFVIVAAPLSACTCQSCTAILANVVYKLSVTFVTLSLTLTPSVPTCSLSTPPPLSRTMWSLPL